MIGPDDGVQRECAINFDHLQTVAKNRLGGIIATLPQGRMVEIRDALLFALGY